MTTTGVTKNTVMSFIKHLNDGDFKAARKCVDDDLKFEGVMGSREGADAYFNDMEIMKFKYHVIQTFADGDYVCLLYNIDMGGTTIFTCGCYHLEHNKIVSLKVVFDPRPLLVQHKK